MDIKERLSIARHEYIKKYSATPNVIFVSNNLFAELDAMVGGLNLYDAAPKHLWNAAVVMVLTPNYFKFAEHLDILRAVKSFQVDRYQDSYNVEKTSATIGSVGGGLHNLSQVIRLEPIEFSKEEVEVYSMQT